MIIGLFFGSFNPIHTGHLIIASHVVNNYVDKIWFIISPQNPLKSTADLLNGEKRFELVRLSIKDDARFEVSDVEFDLPSPSYTIDTITHLKLKFPEHTFYLIIGSDNYINISKWKSFEKILADERLLIYERPGFIITHKSLLNKNTTIMKSPLLNISSTMIRTLLSQKKSIRYMVPEIVDSIIKQYNYYR